AWKQVCHRYMNAPQSFFSSVTKKQIIGITGLGIGLFALIHMAGNLFLLVGPEAYNSYAYHLDSNPFLPVAEVGLVAFFLIHILFTISLTQANRRARQVGYYQLPHSDGKGTSFAARTMILSGLLLFAFVVTHLLTFKWGANYTTSMNGI